MYPCYLTNDRGKACSKQCDPFGHHAHVCDVTNKTLDHNHARDIVTSTGGAIGFIEDEEEVVCRWEKKPDVELVDPTSELLTIYLDVTLPAVSSGGYQVAYRRFIPCPRGKEQKLSAEGRTRTPPHRVVVPSIHFD